MKRTYKNHNVNWFLLGATAILISACCSLNRDKARTKTITLFDREEISANTGISKSYVNVQGFHYANIFVEFEQNTADEEPVSVGALFSLSPEGELSARRYFSFDENFNAPANPQFIDVSGVGSWHGLPHKRSAYIIRLPVMGPYLLVVPFNRHDESRIISVKIYASE